MICGCGFRMVVFGVLLSVFSALLFLLLLLWIITCLVLVWVDWFVFVLFVLPTLYSVCCFFWVWAGVFMVCFGCFAYCGFVWFTFAIDFVGEFEVGLVC